jgi:hypothetical protein
MGPGSKSDQPAYEQTSLAEITEMLPTLLFVAADAAYIITKHIPIPFTGSQCQDQVKDAFHGFLKSQLQNRIENAFGCLLTTKWRILQWPLECSLKVNADILNMHVCPASQLCN